MTPDQLGKVDVLVIGAGNAAANAALSAHASGATVALIETAPREARGGNSAFTGGAFRFKDQRSRTSSAYPPTSPILISQPSISAATPKRSISTTWVASPNTVAIPTSPRS